MSGLKIEDKVFLITGVANKKSVATFTAKMLIENGAKVIFTAQNQKNLENVNKIFPESPVFLLDVENSTHLSQLKENILIHTQKIDGFLHSMAFANFEDGIKPFVETKLEHYLQACHISSFSLVQISNEIKSILTNEASIVTVSISNTKATSYGYLGPIKAMLESTVCFLAKSLSESSCIRVNSVGAGPLKTSASAGIPDYVDNYLYSQALTLRKEGLKTQEVANTIGFLLSPISSGINAENIIVDLGMNSNYFDKDVVKSYGKINII
jgi:enoyl-[acyl-carrier protein] reductase I